MNIPVQEDGFVIQPYHPRFSAHMVAVWESSVCATHHFLSVADVAYYKSVVSTIDFGAFPVFCLVAGEEVAGFIGVANRKIEMLFLLPSYIGRGLGRRLLDFAIAELNADSVDVNEQNHPAVDFYKKAGFTIYARDENDSEGKPYPILKMRLRRG